MYNLYENYYDAMRVQRLTDRRSSDYDAEKKGKLKLYNPHEISVSLYSLNTMWFLHLFYYVYLCNRKERFDSA